MPFVASADGFRLKYEVEGDGPWLLLHLGAGCDSGLWRAAGYLPALAERYRCILFDHRGHGESDKPPGPQANHIDRYVADVVGLLDHLGVEHTAYWGYSNGVAVGLKLADEHADRLWAQVGSGAFGRPPDPVQLREAVMRSVTDLQTEGWKTMIAGFDRQEPEPVPEWMKARIEATDLGQLIGYTQARLEWGWSVWDAMPRVATPTLFLTGELEDPEDVVSEAVARMPHAERVRISGQGHINAFIKSELVLPHALAFLGRHAPSAGGSQSGGEHEAATNTSKTSSISGP